MKISKVKKKTAQIIGYQEVYNLITIGRYFYYDEQAESQDEINNPQLDEDYIDFRTYPINIDWGEVENDKSSAYNIYNKYGYFGVAVFSSLSNVNKLKISVRRYISNIVEYYYECYHKNSPESLTSLREFIENLPQLDLFRQVIYKRLVSKNELVLMKIVLDIYESYYYKYDGPLYKV